MTKLTEERVSPEDLPEGRIVPGDSRHSEFHGVFLSDKLIQELTEGVGTNTSPHLTRALACGLQAEWKHDKEYFTKCQSTKKEIDSLQKLNEVLDAKWKGLREEVNTLRDSEGCTCDIGDGKHGLDCPIARFVGERDEFEALAELHSAQCEVEYQRAEEAEAKIEQLRSEAVAAAQSSLAERKLKNDALAEIERMKEEILSCSYHHAQAWQLPDWASTKADVKSATDAQLEDLMGTCHKEDGDPYDKCLACYACQVVIERE